MIVGSGSRDFLRIVKQIHRITAAIPVNIKPLKVSRQSAVIVLLLLAAVAPSSGSERQRRQQQGQQGRQQGQDCALAKVKPCVDTLLEQANNNVIAYATNDTLRDTCRRIQDAMACVSTYISACATEAERKQFTTTVSSTSGLMDSLCRPGEFQDQFLEHVPCLRLVSMDYHYCGHLYKKTVTHIQRGDDRSARPEVCCTFNEYTNCSRTMSRSLCGSDGAEFVDRYLDRFGDATLTESCGLYREDPSLCPRSAAPARLPGAITLLLAVCTPLLLLLLQLGPGGWPRPLR